MNLVLPDPAILKEVRLQIANALTDLELMAFSRQAQGFQVEWLGDEGVLLMSPRGWFAALVGGALLAQVMKWSRDRRSGRTFGCSVGCRIADGSVLSPDVAWITTEQFDAFSPEQRDGFLPFWPDLIIEVKSPSDTMGYLRKKCHRWLSAGAKSVLLVDPEKRSSEFFLPDGTHESSTDGQRAIRGSDGLTLDLAEAWDGDSAAH